MSTWNKNDKKLICSNMALSLGNTYNALGTAIQHPHKDSDKAAFINIGKSADRVNTSMFGEDGLCKEIIDDNTLELMNFTRNTFNYLSNK